MNPDSGATGGRRSVRRLGRLLRNLDRDLAVLSLFLLVALVLAQIVARVVFSAPLVGAEELVRYFLICIVCLAGPYAARTGGHIKMDELLSYVPPSVRRAFRILALAASVAVIGIAAYSSVYTMLHNLKNTTATLSIPFWIFFMPNSVGFVLLTVEYGLLLVRLLLGLPAGPSSEAAGEPEAAR